MCVLNRFIRVWLFVTLWTIAHQAPLFMGFSSKNTGVGCHFLLLGIFPTQGVNPCLLCLLHWQAGSLPLAPPEKPPYMYVWLSITESLCCTEEINNFTYFCMMVNSIQPNVLTQALEKNESSLVCTGRGSSGPVIWEEEEVIRLEWGAHFHPGNLAHQHRKWNFPSYWSLNAQSARYWVIIFR